VARPACTWLSLEEVREELRSSQNEERKARQRAKSHIKVRDYEAAIAALTEALSHKAFREGLAITRGS
jgi:hypothetical protein